MPSKKFINVTKTKFVAIGVQVLVIITTLFILICLYLYSIDLHRKSGHYLENNDDFDDDVEDDRGGGDYDVDDDHNAYDDGDVVRTFDSANKQQKDSEKFLNSNNNNNNNNETNITIQNDLEQQNNKTIDDDDDDDDVDRNNDADVVGGAIDKESDRHRINLHINNKHHQYNHSTTKTSTKKSPTSSWLRRAMIAKYWRKLINWIGESITNETDPIKIIDLKWKRKNRNNIDRKKSIESVKRNFSITNLTSIEQENVTRNYVNFDTDDADIDEEDYYDYLSMKFFISGQPLIATCFFAYLFAIIGSIAIGLENHRCLILLSVIFGSIFIITLIQFVFNVCAAIFDGQNFQLNYWNSLILLILLVSGLEFYTIAYLLCFISYEKHRQRSNEYCLAKMLNEIDDL
ncbi:hypothetical protein SSS_02044 [Sarcoptes scabiei]|uniref:Uncharacterized protein n=1 Tax=Sarcoptes scabiei TaxID=52283 RepID=A0A834VDD2_SARSC|nr:hypothetical protein SSS_02044 [Sarcoptes scabiei]